MATPLERIFQAWEHRDGPAVLATVDPDGSPNIIYVSFIKRYGDDKFAVADTYFHKTRDNVQRGGRAALLFITRDGVSYQVKGDMEYHTAGLIFEDIRKTWILPDEPVAALVLTIRHAYRQSEKLI
jgi:uncharacterized protein